MYLRVKGKELNYWLFEDAELDKVLSKFWFEARTKKRDKYTVSSMKNIRYALARVLKKHGKENDIVKSDVYIKSQQKFEECCRHLKKIGKGVVHHYKEIKPKDLMKLYHCREMDPDQGPVELQRKVMFDIRYYFCRRGNKNFQDFTKDTFQLQFDIESGITYVKKVIDEMTKNHQETNEEVVTGFMPPILCPDGKPHKLCPVRSFENYMSQLSDKCDKMWQRPIKKLKSSKSYAGVSLGHNPVEKCMGNMSKLCELSDYYTNHCIRVTGATNLTRSNYTAKQVMSVTGHKSIQSLSIYQRVREDDKLSMGISLVYSLLHPQEVGRLTEIIQKERKALEDKPHQNPVPQLQNVAPEPLQQAQPLPVLPNIGNMEIQANTVENIQNEIVPYQPKEPEIPDFNIVDILQGFEDDDLFEDQMVMAATQVEQNTMTMKKAVMKKQQNAPNQKPTFNNCRIGSIGTINIHIHKT